MDRRRHPRIPVHHLMEVRLVADGIDAVGRVLDLNNAGAFVATDVVLEKASKVQVELRIPGEDKSLPIQAVVARRTDAIEGRNHTIPAGLGLVFLTTNVMERAFIQVAVLDTLKRSLQSTREIVAASPSREATT